MTSRPTTPRAVGLRCDAAPRIGVGHVIRCLALGDEVRATGGRSVLLGSVEVPWVRALAESRGVRIIAPEADPTAFAEQCVDLGLDAVALDGYDLDRGLGTALQARGIRVLSLVDGDFGRGQAADVYLDQNLGAVPPLGPSTRAAELAGLRYTLLRDEILRRRPSAPVARPGRPRLLAVFGGTDPSGAAPVVVPLVLAAGAPVDIVAVTADPEIAVALADITCGADQSIEVLPAVPDLGALAAECDLAVTAAGSSVWELLCIGLPTAVVMVADNQEIGYRATLDQGTVAFGARLADLRAEESARTAFVDECRALLTDPARRLDLARRGMALIDGRGRERVLAALLPTAEAPPR